MAVFQKNKYLEDLGLKKEDYGVNWLSKDADRLKDFNDEKEDVWVLFSRNLEYEQNIL